MLFQSNPILVVFIAVYISKLPRLYVVSTAKLLLRCFLENFKGEIFLLIISAHVQIGYHKTDTFLKRNLFIYLLIYFIPEVIQPQRQPRV